MPLQVSDTAANGASPSRPKVLVPEKVSPDGLALLQESLDVHERKGLTPEQLLEAIPEYDALIVRSETKVNAALLSAGKRLKVVARAGVGVDNVDVETATKVGDGGHKQCPSALTGASSMASSSSIRQLAISMLLQSTH